MKLHASTTDTLPLLDGFVFTLDCQLQAAVNGDLTPEELARLFQRLIDTGFAFELEDVEPKVKETAMWLLENGLCRCAS